MEKRRRATALMIACVLVVFAGCSDNGKDTQTTDTTPLETQANFSETPTKAKDSVTIALTEEPETGFDPCTGWGRYGSPLIQSTLVKTDAEMNIVMDLATEYSVSEDGLVWTFNIRDDAYFTDGEKLTAADVAFTYNTAKNSASLVDLTVLESCEAIDENTVVFNLKTPDSTFIYGVAATGIVPEHAYGQDYAQNPIGSGPFQFVQWDKGQQVILKANEDYYGKVPQIKNVNILFMGEGAAFAAAKAGKVDVAATSPSVATAEIEGMELVSIKTIDNRGVTLPTVANTGETTEQGFPIGNNVTSDLAIRQALSYGIDRSKLVIDALNGYGSPAYSECDNMPWWNPETVVEYDKEKAIGILEDSGWVMGEEDGLRAKDGVRAEFNLIYPADDMTRQALAIGFSQQASELGIKVNVEGLSWAEIDQRMFSDAVLMGWGAQNPMESYLLYHSVNKGKDYYNPESFSNPAVDKHFDEALSSLTLEEACENFKLAQWDKETGTSTLGDCPLVWLVNLDHMYYVSDGLDIGEQKLHPHGHSWPLLANLEDWEWTE